MTDVEKKDPVDEVVGLAMEVMEIDYNQHRAPDAPDWQDVSSRVEKRLRYELKGRKRHV